MKLELRAAPGMPAADKELLADINELMARGLDRFASVIVEAARKFIQMTDKGRERMKAHPNPQVAGFSAALERVAARELHPRLAITNGWAAKKLGEMTYDVQEEVLTRLIPVAMPDGDHVNKPVDDLSRDETAQVFDSTTQPPTLRTIEEQRAWLAAKRLAEQRLARQERNQKLIVRKGRYRIQGSHFFPIKDRFSLRELEAVLADLRRLQG